MGMKRRRKNAASSASQYGAAQAVLSGASSLMPRKVARELIDRTPARLREKFSRELAARRRGNPIRTKVVKRGGYWFAEMSSGGGVSSARYDTKAEARRAVREYRHIHRTGSFLNPRGKRGKCSKRRRNFGGKDFRGAPARYEYSIRWQGHEIGRAYATSKTDAVRQFRKSHGDTTMKVTAVKQKDNPRRRRRRNQETVDADLKSAERMYTKFHGRKPKGHQVVEQARSFPSVLSDCGKMIELDVRPLGKLKFNGTGVRLGVTGEGGQLYFVKGDQAIPLNGIPHKGKDHLDLGVAHRIVYLTSKDFHNFEPSEYVHRFGEEDGIKPTLHYDVRSRRLYLTGGNYQVKRAGIVN